MNHHGQNVADVENDGSPSLERTGAHPYGMLHGTPSNVPILPARLPDHGEANALPILPITLMKTKPPVSCFSINTKTLFHSGNNPTLRLDAGFGKAIKTLEEGPVDNSTSTYNIINGLFKNKDLFNRWEKALRTKKTIEEVEKHICVALTGSEKKTHFSETVQENIHKMAKALCLEESKIIESEILEDLVAIKRLQMLAEA